MPGRMTDEEKFVRIEGTPFGIGCDSNSWIVRRYFITEASGRGAGGVERFDSSYHSNFKNCITYIEDELKKESIEAGGTWEGVKEWSELAIQSFMGGLRKLIDDGGLQMLLDRESTVLRPNGNSLKSKKRVAVKT